MPRSALSASILETAPDALLAADRDGRVVEVNLAAESMFGRGREDLVGAALDDLLGVPNGPGERLSRATSILEESDAPICRRLELFGVRADGTRFPADVALVTTAAEPPLAAWVRDLTRAQGAQAEALRRKALLERAERISRIGSWQWTPATGEVIWSEESYRIFGYAPQSVTPTVALITRHVHPDDVDRWGRAIERLARAYTLPPLDMRITRADGALRHLRITMAVVEDRPSGARTIAGSTQDVTEQRRAERQIAAHVAVSEALAAWDTLDGSSGDLLRRLALAIDFTTGALWIPSGTALVPVAAWHEPAFPAPELEARTARTRFARGTGLPGRAWDTGAAIHLVDLPADPGYDRRLPAAAAAGLRSALALPAVHGGEVLAVLELFSREHAELGDALRRSLIGIGHDIGQFLSRRRGELHPPPLTARETEILQLAAEGNSGRMIAHRLVLSPATVKSHFEHIYAKLGVSDRAAAVAEALRLGVIR